MPEGSLPVARPAPDAESLGWIEALGSVGPVRDDAVERLHALLLRATHFEVARRRGALGDGDRPSDFDDLAMQAADDALMAIMSKLHTFRGDSRFTTWAYKFALYEAAVKLRKRAWQGREIPLEPETWGLFSSVGLGPQAEAEQSELLGALQAAIEEVLTPHQRRVLVALGVNGVPIDVLAERLNTNRGALYKTLHDARRKLRRALDARGFALDDTEEK
jgi:RNA polymerase sigma-70 factor, ECF subfamily